MTTQVAEAADDVTSAAAAAERRIRRLASPGDCRSLAIAVESLQRHTLLSTAAIP